MKDKKYWKELTEDELNDLIDEWHESGSGLLRDYLGMTYEEYVTWLTQGMGLIDPSRDERAD